MFCNTNYLGRKFKTLLIYVFLEYKLDISNFQNCQFYASSNYPYAVKKHFSDSKLITKLEIFCKEYLLPATLNSIFVSI